MSPVLISYDHPIHIYNLVSSELTVDLVCSPSVGYVQLLFPIEQAEIDFSVALHRILEPFRLRVDPLFRAQTGDKQCHRDARAEERQKNHTAFEQIHFSSCPTVRLRREHRTVFFISTRRRKLSEPEILPYVALKSPGRLRVLHHKNGYQGSHAPEPERTDKCGGHRTENETTENMEQVAERVPRCCPQGTTARTVGTLDTPSWACRKLVESTVSVADRGHIRFMMWCLL